MKGPRWLRRYIEVSDDASRQHPVFVARPLMVISPHYDDAVFSCGSLLSITPHSTVVTVYTGLPDKTEVLTDWDQRCGFSNAYEAMSTRAAENEKALSALHAHTISLNFLDSQYTSSPASTADLLEDTLGSTIAGIQPSTVLFPLGLFHDDHIQVSNALMSIHHHFSSINWLLYEDIPYRKQVRLVQKRVIEISRSGIIALPLAPEPPKRLKARAVNAYGSQFRGLGYKDGEPILQQHERYWKIHGKVALL